MEELYNLVDKKNQLKLLLEKEIRYTGVEQAFNRIPDDCITPEISNFVNEKLKKFDDIYQEIEIFIKSQIDSIDNRIKEITIPFKKSGYKVIPQQNKEEMIFNYVTGGEEDAFRLLNLDEDLEEMVGTIISSYSSWKYPSLEIGCGRGAMTHYMKSADPLYVTDVNKNSMTDMRNKFNQIYQKRIRTYLNNSDSATRFDFLPQNQFKFILSWNVFNYYPEHEFRETMKSCWNLLRQGGEIMFSYNDCDFLPCVKKACNGDGSWLTEETVRSILTDIGYEIYSINHADGQIHWVEASKPGELTTVKVHPSIGKIALT